MFINFAYVHTCHYSMLRNLSDGIYGILYIKRIQWETQKLALHKYNKLVYDHLSWKDVTDLSSSTCWNPADGNNITLPPRSIRLAAINAYVKKLRNVISFYLNQYDDIN